MTSTRTGIFGGTFDPIHIGHLVAASDARHQLGLDQMLLMVANVPWQKADGRDVSEARHRFEMVARSVQRVEGVEASSLELDRGGDSYTIDTLEELGDRGQELFLLIGSDVAPQLDTWHRPEALRPAAHLVVVERPGAIGGVPPADWPYQMLRTPLIDVSSTELRRRARAGEPLDFLVPGPALDLIAELGLYGYQP